MGLKDKIKKKIKWKIIAFIIPNLGMIFLFLAAAGVMLVLVGSSGSETLAGTAMPLSPEVEALRGVVAFKCEQYGIPDYVDLCLAVMMQESGGRVNDVFQCSESLGLPPNSIGREESIDQGVKLLSGYIRECEVTSPSDLENIRTVLQGYNYGNGYIGYAKSNGGKWTQDNALAFQEKMAIQIGSGKRSGSAAETLGPWNYGDAFYTDHVLRYYPYGYAGSSDGNAIIEEAMSHLGKPYVWGAAGPDSFDCSGLVYFVYMKTGRYTGGRTTAEGYRLMSTQISETEAQPGDLVFFQNSSGAEAHHIGIVTGQGMMIHAPQTGDVVKIASYQRQNQIVTFGRLGG